MNRVFLVQPISAFLMVALMVTTGHAKPECDAEKLAGAAKLFTQKPPPDKYWPALAVSGPGVHCAGHPAAMQIAEAINTPKLKPVERQARLVAVVHLNLELLARGCPEAVPIVKAAGRTLVLPKHVRAVAKACRFVEDGLITSAELEALGPLIAPLVPMYRALMEASKVDPFTQRVFLRGVLELRTKPQETPTGK